MEREGEGLLGLQEWLKTASSNERLVFYCLGGDHPALGSALSYRGFGLLLGGRGNDGIIFKEKYKKILVLMPSL
jgi:hypothetical protein